MALPPQLSPGAVGGSYFQKENRLYFVISQGHEGVVWEREREFSAYVKSVRSSSCIEENRPQLFKRLITLSTL